MEQAKGYANLIRIKGKTVDICRIRLYDGHRYNWHHQICNKGTLYCPTDQSYDLGSRYSSDINFWDEIWIDGVRIHKKSWWRKLLLTKHLD